MRGSGVGCKGWDLEGIDVELAWEDLVSVLGEW